MKNDKIPYEKLTQKQKTALAKAVPLGLVEVSCPWWPTNHWEEKRNLDFFDEATYRIKKQ